MLYHERCQRLLGVEDFGVDIESIGDDFTTIFIGYQDIVAKGQTPSMSVDKGSLLVFQ
jgi:hypothetical protein